MNFSGQVVIEREFERLVIWRRNTSNVLFFTSFFCSGFGRREMSLCVYCNEVISRGYGPQVSPAITSYD